MHKNLHGSTFTTSSSKGGGEALGNSLETKDSGHVPLTLEAKIPLLSQQVPESLTHPECSDSKSHKPEPNPFLCQDDQSTLGKDKPSAIVERSISPRVTNKSLSGDDHQLSVKKACIVHLNRQFDSVHYLCSAPVEKCLVIKYVEIAPGLYAKRSELHNPSYRYTCTVTVGLLMMY